MVGLCSVRIPTSDSFFFFFNDTATTEIYTLSLHDALPICHEHREAHHRSNYGPSVTSQYHTQRSEEHTSELQSHLNLVCRLLLEKKKRKSILQFVMILLNVLRSYLRLIRQTTVDSQESYES